MKLFGNPVRKITSGSHLFLTFDDGPDPLSTPQILKKLDQMKTKATFFVVGKKALKYRSLMNEILSSGHTLGNHSLDHSYSNFFMGKAAMLDWVDDSEKILNDAFGETVGFRPPAGVRTPELAWSLSQLSLEMVLWNIRFFDTVFPWSPSRIWKTHKPGSIILLHDKKPQTRLPLFLDALQVYINRARENGVDFARLTKRLVQEQANLER